jgi:hypothetical protein
MNNQESIENNNINIEEKRKYSLEYFDFLFQNIELFIKNIDIIKSNDKYYNLLGIRCICVLMYTGADTKPITLGDLLLLYINENDYSLDCDCGNKAYIYNFGGSPLSGSIVDWYAKCPKCRKTISKRNYKNDKGRKLFCVNNYKKNEVKSNDINILKELVDKIKK